MADGSQRNLRKFVNSTIRQSARREGRQDMIETEAMDSEAPSHETIERAIAALDEKLVDAAQGREKLTEIDQQIIDQGRSAGEKILVDGIDASLSPSEEMALEAIAIADGSRPALLIKENAIDPADPLANEWADELQRFAGAIRTLSPSVGRIDNNGRQIGTGWMLRPGYVVTNRHVAQPLSVDPTAERLKLSPLRNPTICFGHEADEKTPHPLIGIKDIVFCGERHIDPYAGDLALLDIAILKLDQADEAKWPDPLPSTYVQTADVVIGSDLYALGYPGTTATSTLPQKTLLKLLGEHRGVKRFSPGEISVSIGGINGDAPKRTIAHDVTTLGGSSGSVMLSFDDGGRPKLAGLHFGGYEVRYGPGGVVERYGRNYAHCFAAMSDILRLIDNAIIADLESRRRPSALASPS